MNHESSLTLPNTKKFSKLVFRVVVCVGCVNNQYLQNMPIIPNTCKSIVAKKVLFDLREMQIGFFAAAKTTSPLPFHVKIAITTKENAAQRRGRRKEGKKEATDPIDLTPILTIFQLQTLDFMGQVDWQSAYWITTVQNSLSVYNIL